MSEIYKELKSVQQSIAAPKNQFNKFGNYAYRNCEDILNAFKKVKTDASIILSDEIVLVGDRYYIKATASFRLGNEALFNTAYARESLSKKGMDESQITGTASSYARKYALNGLLAIDDTKDADDRDNKEPSFAQKKLDLMNIIKKEKRDNTDKVVAKLKDLKMDEKTCDVYLKTITEKGYDIFLEIIGVSNEN